MSCLEVNMNTSTHLEQRQTKPLGHIIKILENVISIYLS